MQAIKNHYISKGAILGPDQEIDFEPEVVEDQSVSLNIPSDGKEINEDFWLVPLTHPCVCLHDHIMHIIANS